MIELLLSVLVSSLVSVDMEAPVQHGRHWHRLEQVLGSIQ